MSIYISSTTVNIKTKSITCEYHTRMIKVSIGIIAAELISDDDRPISQLYCPSHVILICRV